MSDTLALARELIERAFLVGDIKTAEVLVPRVDVVAVQADTPADA